MPMELQANRMNFLSLFFICLMCIYQKRNIKATYSTSLYGNDTVVK